MSKEFYYAGRWNDNVPGTTGAAGVVIMPAGLPRETLVRRDRKRDKLQEKRGLFPLDEPRRLLDPQVYLASLPAEECKKTCANLASYPWFARADAEQFDSGTLSQTQWRRRQKSRIADLWHPPTNDTESITRVVKAVINLQVELKCEALILPSPLIRNPSSDLAVELEWVDVGLEQAKALAPHMAAYVTVAISDMCLSGVAPKTNGLVDAIVDQVTARAPGGVYFVLEQAFEQGYNCVDEDTVGSVLRLASDLKAGGIPRLIMSYCGVLGLVALCAGADAWVSGWLKSERRIQLRDIASEDSPRKAFAAYYSHSLAGEINVKNDLPWLAKNGLLDSVLDETPASEDLIAAMRLTGVPPAEWTGQTTRAAKEHFMMSVIRETAKVSALADGARKRYGLDWLTQAAKVARELRVIPNINKRTELAHQRRWQEAFAPHAGAAQS